MNNIGKFIMAKGREAGNLPPARKVKAEPKPAPKPVAKPMAYGIKPGKGHK